MLYVSNCSDLAVRYNHKESDRNYGVKACRKTLDAEKYVRDVDVAIFKHATEDPNFVIARTANFAKEQLAMFDIKLEKDIYSNIIKRCFDDIDKAVLKNAPQETIDKLTKTLELFVKKYGHLAK